MVKRIHLCFRLANAQLVNSMTLFRSGDIGVPNEFHVGGDIATLLRCQHDWS